MSFLVGHPVGSTLTNPSSTSWLAVEGGTLAEPFRDRTGSREYCFHTSGFSHTTPNQPR